MSKRKMGRPTLYSEELTQKILAEIMMGRGLTSICRDEGMPDVRTVVRWLADDRYVDFRLAYARAREVQADVLVEQIMEIADTPVMGVRTKIDAAGNKEVTEGDMIEHRRLQVDARKWYAAKLYPKKYSEKHMLEHSGDLKITSIAERMRKRRRNDADH